MAQIYRGATWDGVEAKTDVDLRLRSLTYVG